MRFTRPRRLLLAIPIALVVVASTLAGSPTDRAGAAIDHTQHVTTVAGGAPVAIGKPITPASAAAAPAAGTFLETFDGVPTSPLSFTNPHGWDIIPAGFDPRQNGTDAQRAHHGPDCGRPGFPYTSTNAHPISSARDMVFVCNNHLMTATGLSGYGAVYMVPPALADFSAGTTTISFEMSTLRTSSRDWVYFTLMPFHGHNKFAYNNLDQAIPENNINIHLAGSNVLTATQRTDDGTDTRIGGDGFTTWDMVQEANGVAPDAARRDAFRIELTRSHLRVCITGNSSGQSYAYRGESGLCWIDSDLPAPLSAGVWNDQAVFMMTHVAYNPEKSCSSEDDRFSIVHNPFGDANCPPNTWHWDNVRIDPAVPFTIINPQEQFASFADPSGSNTVTFSRPAPADAFLSYIADGDCTQQRFSVNGGSTWISSVPQPTATQCKHPENGGEYWTRIPEGTTSVKFTGQATFGRWGASGIAIWAGGGTLPPSDQPNEQRVQASPSGLSGSWVDQSAYPTIAPGATASVSVRFRNTGSQAWERGVPGRQVNLGIVGDATTFSDLGIAIDWLSANRPASTQEQSVAPGQVGTFAFGVRAPAAAGRYRLPLRLVLDGVAWLPDQGVYIVVTSDAGHHSAWVAQSPWPMLRPGDLSAPLSFTFRNTGTSTWRLGSSTQANLAVANDDTSWGPLGASWPSEDRPATQTEIAVGPGALATFTFQVRAPEAPGTYSLELRPVIDGVTWLEDDGVYVLITVAP
jgi:hypothetical protein